MSSIHQMGDNNKPGGFTRYDYDKVNRFFNHPTDGEGTLASYGSPTSIILTSPQRIIDTLNEVLMDKNNIVYVMSGRTPEELERLFSCVPGLGIVAENGCFVRECGRDEAQNKRIAWSFRILP
ncbi:uncharacterized protein J3D65DRAFT_620336 [Phyllosticta citribraziliensis]|uniref:Uncharacterized protein n=1 Tax=Phyllosticta citribraziliensis TaxID=989973 RepID=A0ABR1LXN5_9PEZI